MRENWREPWDLVDGMRVARVATPLWRGSEGEVGARPRAGHFRVSGSFVPLDIADPEANRDERDEAEEAGGSLVVAFRCDMG